MNIVVVGGGFGGVKTALELARRDVKSVTLISDKDYFLHHGLLYSTAVGRDSRESVFPLDDIFAHFPEVKIVHDTITSLNAEKHELVGQKKTYKYDHLVLALGGVDYFYGIDGAKKYSYSSRTLDGVQAFNSAFHDALITDEVKSFSCAVIGGGATGVELAGALSEYAKLVSKAHSTSRTEAKITIYEKQKRLLPGLSSTATKKVSSKLKSNGVKIKAGHEIERISKTHIIFDGKRIPVDLAIWTCGGKNNPFFTKHRNIFHFAQNGRVTVNQYLSAYPDIYVIGDSADTPGSGMASGALRHADFIAKHLERISKGKLPKPYRRMVSRPFISLPITRFWAYSEWLGIYASGALGSMARRLAELMSYCRLMPFGKSYKMWRKYRNMHQSCLLCEKHERFS